jgi:hypothetical protein
LKAFVNYSSPRLNPKASGIVYINDTSRNIGCTAPFGKEDSYCKLPQ